MKPGELLFAVLLFAALLFAMPAAAASGEPRVVQLPGKSPLITLRFVFTTGSAADPADKPGVAHLTGDLLGHGATKDLTYKQVVDAMYPMATSIQVYSDKEMTTFVGETHIDNLDKFYGLMRDAILHPGWRADDFERVRDDTVNALRVSLRGNNDEELGKEELYNVIYSGRPYGHENLGTVAALKKMTVADLREFYGGHYTQANLIIGIAGGYPPEFLEKVKRDFAALPAGPADKFDDLPAPPGITHNRATLLRKDTRSVAWSFGYPIDVKRGDPEFPALLVMQSWLGQHRESAGRLFARMREIRGLNYGDYAYIEYFPRGMFRFEPEPNLARHQQIFQVWIRPVEPPNAVFALRLALFELNKMIKDGIPPAEFEKTRLFLSKYVNLLTKTKSAELGYAIDSAYYGIPNYNEYIRAGLARLTVADVNTAIRKHLRAGNLEIVAVAKDTDAITASLTGEGATPIHYNTTKPQDVLDEDKIVERWPLHLRKEDVTVVPVETVFEKLTAGELAARLKLPLRGDADRPLTGAAMLEDAGPEQLAFAGGPKYFDAAARSTAGCIIAVPEFTEASGQTIIESPQPRAHFAQALSLLYPAPEIQPGLHPSAVVGEGAEIDRTCQVGPFVTIGCNARIGAGVRLGAGTTIGPDCEIGAECVIHPRVSIYERVKIGARCVIHCGAVIGADGFGFEMAGGTYQKVPQVGFVMIGDDVEIGANTCIDRATLGATTIGDGTKLDNMVHVAHNCRIGRHVVIAAQTGLAGGVTIGDYAVVGGQVGVGDKARIEPMAIIGSGAGILTSKIVRAGEPVWGTPARPLRQYLAQLAVLARLSKRRK